MFYMCFSLLFAHACGSLLFFLLKAKNLLKWKNEEGGVVLKGQ